MANPTLKIGHIKITDHLILGVTQERIKRTEENLTTCNLETVAKTGWNEIADALTAEELDGAFVLAPTAMDLYKAGVPLKLVLFTHKSGSILIKNKAANINAIEDFKGKVVLIPYQLSIHNMLFHRLLADKGLKPGTGSDKDADVLLEVMAPAMMNQALEFDEDGEIGGYIVAEPYGSQAVKGGYGEELYLSKDLWSDHPCCVFVVNEKFAGKNPDAVHEVTAALVRSGNFVNTQPEAAAEIGAGFLGQEKDVIHRVLSEPPDRFKTGELMPVLDDLAKIQDYMHDKMGIMKSKIDLEKFVDLSYAQTAGAK
jgi:NitT/TauT family transport system substrate-binding protein